MSYGDTFAPIYGTLSEHAPRIYGIKIDALHDLLQVFYVAVKTEGDRLWIGVVGASLGFMVIGVVLWGRLYDSRTWSHIFRQYPPLEFVIICVGLLCFASLIDLEIIIHHYLVFLEEILETLASLALLFSLLSLRPRCQSSISE